MKSRNIKLKVSEWEWCDFETLHVGLRYWEASPWLLGARSYLVATSLPKLKLEILKDLAVHRLGLRAYALYNFYHGSELKLFVVRENKEKSEFIETWPEFLKNFMRFEELTDDQKQVIEDLVKSITSESEVIYKQLLFYNNMEENT